MLIFQINKPDDIIQPYLPKEKAKEIPNAQVGSEISRVKNEIDKNIIGKTSVLYKGEIESDKKDDKPYNDALWSELGKIRDSYKNSEWNVILVDDLGRDMYRLEFSKKKPATAQNKKNDDLFASSKVNSAVGEIQRQIEALDKFSDFDNLQLFSNRIGLAIDAYTQAKADIIQTQLGNDAKAEYLNRIDKGAQRALEQYGLAPFALMDQNGYVDFATSLYNLKTSIAGAVKKLNDFEFKLSDYMHFPTDANRAALDASYNATFGTGGNPDMFTRLGLQWALKARYGNNGEGLDAPAKALNIELAPGKDVVSRYNELMVKMMGPEGNSLVPLAEFFRAGYPASDQTLATEQKSVVLDDGSLAFRKGIDPLSQIMIFDAVKNGLFGVGINDGKLNEIIRTTLGLTPNMPTTADQKLQQDANQRIGGIPPGVGGILLSNKKFFDRVAGTGEDPQAIFDIARQILKDAYNNAPLDEKYEAVQKVMDAFGTASIDGNFLLDVEGDFVKLSGAHISVVANINNTFRADIPYNIQWFMNYPGQLAPEGVSLFSSSLVPEITPNSNIVYSPLYRSFLLKKYFDQIYLTWGINSDTPDYNYWQNILGYSEGYQNLIGAMYAAYYKVMSSMEKESSVSFNSAQAGMRLEPNKFKYDANASLLGERGEFVWGDYYHMGEKTLTSTFDDKGTYNESIATKTSDDEAELRSTGLKTLGLKIWNLYLRYGDRKNEQLIDPRSSSDAMNLVAQLNAQAGNSSVVFNAVDARAEVTRDNFDDVNKNYIIEGYVRSGADWYKIDLRGISHELNNVLESFDHYFGEAYNEWSQDVITHFGVEADRRKFGLSGGPDDNRLGLSFAIEPGIPIVLGGAKTVTDDYTAYGAYEWGERKKPGGERYSVRAGFYSFNDKSLAQQGGLIGNNAWLTSNQYLNYGLGTRLPPVEGVGRTNLGALTIKALGKWSVSGYGGWRTEGNQTIAGATAKAPNWHITTFDVFRHGYLDVQTGLFSAGGKFGNLNASMYAFKMESGLEEQGFALSIKKVNLFGDKGTLSIYGRNRSDLEYFALNARRDIAGLETNVNNVNNAIENLTPLDFLDPNRKQSAIQSITGMAIEAGTQMIQMMPEATLFTQPFPTNIMAAFRGRNVRLKFGASVSKEDGAFFSGITDFRTFGLFGGVLAPSGTERPDVIDLLAGVQLKPSDNSKYSLYTVKPKNDAFMGVIGAEVENAFSLRAGYKPSSAASGQIWFTNLSIGDENISVYTNYGQMDEKFLITQVGLNLRLTQDLWIILGAGYEKAKGLDLEKMKSIMPGYYNTAQLHNLFFGPNFNVKEGAIDFVYRVPKSYLGDGWYIGATGRMIYPNGLDPTIYLFLSVRKDLGLFGNP